PQLTQLTNLKIRGLMTILPLGLSEEEIFQAFSVIKNLKMKINQESSLSLTELSMGMSEDYQYAINAGSTMIRLGRILFEAK
ncbi:MAG: alanine racemase, partial [Dolichospermum sp.]